MIGSVFGLLATGNGKAPIVQAFEEAIVFFVVAFLSAIIATKAQYPPDGAVLYAAILPGALAGAMAWARARKIPVGTPVGGTPP